MRKRCSVVVLVTLLCMGSGWAQEEGVWSGLVNVEGGRLDYQCPDNLALSGVASDFVAAAFDRRWEFLCTSAGGLANVSLSCQLESTINSLQSDLDFDCPNNGFLAGFVSEYDAGDDDRLWQPYCCSRPFATLINCQKPTSFWENVLRDNLNFTSPDSQVIAGVESFWFNRDRRWRFRTCDVQVDCGDPGVPDNAVRDGNNFLYNSNVTFTCNHGYYQSSGPVGGVRRCLETGLWSDDQPVCSACTPIANCADLRCTNSSDQFCEMCASNNGPALGERAYTNLHTECQPKCSWLTTFCYPGNCPDHPSSCNCSAGFEGSDCLQISESPELLSCEVTVMGVDGSEDLLPCQQNSTTPLVYTNFVPHRLDAEWGVAYVVPTPFPIPKPAYVADFSVGVATSEIQATLFRASNPHSPVSMTTHPCEGASVSPDTPISDIMVTCSSTALPANLSEHTFLHGDRLEVQVVTSAGGFLDIRNLDLGPAAEVDRHYYNATPTIGRAVFVLDLQPPTHCSLVAMPFCFINQTILSLSGDIVTSNDIAVSWGGWLDVPSGVTSYQLDVYYLENNGGLLTEGALLTTNQTTHTGQATYGDTVYLPREGPYSFVLQSHDLAGNTRYSRRSLLYDFNSSVEIDPTSSLIVTSAVPSTQYLWQNSTDRLILISGVGHFYNTNLRSTNHLAPLANFSRDGGFVAEKFDQALAQGRFPRAGTLNALGIVELRYDIIVDHMGGNSSLSVTQPTSFPHQTSDVGIESVNVSIPVEDGDSVRVWFRAQDFRFQYAVDDVLVHIDSSPPVIEDLALEWNGVSGLSLHGTELLTDLDVQFQTYDEHSGIFSVDWSIATVADHQVVGNGRVTIPMLDPTSCSAPQCVCDPLNHCTPRNFSVRPGDFTDPQALHDTDYIVTVVVTNHAQLSSTLSHVFTVDTTPPLQGHVMDGNESHDIDYQTNLDLSARWSGFFDRETDVMVYQYVFDTQCANSTPFTFPPKASSQAIQTTETMATWTAPSEGTYYVTVVAFNQALQPSRLLCSDGVTIDTVAPEIVGVVVPGAVVRPGLVSDLSGGVWYVRRDRVRVWVGACPNTTIPPADLTAYPIGYDGLPADVCTTSTRYTASQLTHLTAEHTLNITWSATDNVGVAIHEVGIVAEQNFTSDGRNVRYHHTAGQTHYSFYDSELLSNGNRFYLSVRVVDFAQQRTVVNVGPILIDVTPPTFNGTLEAVHNGDHVIVTWAEDWFLDTESGVGEYQFAVGQTELGIQILDFQPLPLATPPQCSTPLCVVVDTSTLPLLSGREYYITIKATNRAGLSTHISAPFTHHSRPPTLGYVLDVDPRVTFDLTNRYSSYNTDIDILLDSDLVGVRWGDFVHSNLPVTYFVALGTELGLDDVVPLISIGMATEYVFSNVTLVSGSVYHSLVVAENSVGRVNVSSNGVLVLMGVANYLSSAQVLDGLSPVDVDYQASKTAVSAMWEFPTAVHTYVTHYEWTLLAEGSPLTPYTSQGRDSSVLSSVPELEEGVLYTSAVKACILDVCLDPVLSDGFQVSIPPDTGSIQAVYTPIDLDPEYGVSQYGTLDLMWEQFVGPQVTHYEWSIGNGEMATELLVHWTQTETSSLYGVPVNASVSLHKTNYVSVRGYNSAGLYSMSTVALEWNVGGGVIPQSQVPRSPLAVFDITESDVPPLLTDNWKDIEHIARVYTDIEYTGSAHSLSAVWPHLRYTTYTYSVSTQQQFTSCEDTFAVACGSTINSGVTVTNLDLVDGERYYFCVRGLQSDAIHSATTTPPTLTQCSNGVAVDLTPPTSGCVQIITLSVNESDHMTGSGAGLSSGLGPIPDNIECTGNGTGFLVSTSELFVVWEEFRDVEVGGDSVHVTGVTDYQYAIGTSPGGDDVADFTSVGVVTYAVARDLSLESGLTYYVTIRGTDFVGHVSDAYSQAVTVDTTPAGSVRVWVEGGSSYSSTGLTLNWERPVDVESGVGGLEWALGSRPGNSDVVEWREVGVAQTREGLDGGMFRDGQTLFLSLKVTNGAGLRSISSSPAYLLDHTPPTRGIVYDGPRVTAEVSDLDYTTDLSMLSSHWTQFIDPHSTVVEYLVAIGTEPEGTDVQDTISVGMATEVSFTDLTLSHGHTYYTTVTACNALGLCSSASSNGIRADVTPPTPGRVLSGFSGPDVQYQASRSTLSAHWTGFYDDESEIQYFTYHVGLSPMDSSIAMPTKLPPTQTSLIMTPSTLPTNSTIYITITAVNGAGVRVQSTSSGVYIDDTSPAILDNVTIDTTWAGSVDMATQYSTTALRVLWSYADSLTSVNQFFWSLQSYSNTRAPIPGRTVGSQSHTTATRLHIQDGDTHSVILIGCNQAGLCARSVSGDVLFDSSPPVDGYFAAATESRAVLNRTVPGGMTWRNRNLRGFAQLSIALLGFSDPHSGVSEYWVAVGTSYNGADLMPSSQPEQVHPSLASQERGVSLVLVQLSRVLVEGEVVYVSVWAVNGVGLKSRTVHGTFTVDPQTTVNNNGTLTLLRSSTCPLTLCERQCTCGVRGQPCQFGSVPQCTRPDPSTLPPERQAVIRAVSPQLTPGANDSTLYTAVTDKLVAEWELVDPTSDEVQYLEWSVSEEGFPPGVGVMRVLEGGVWVGVDNQTRLVFTSAESLREGVAYVFHLRAWFNNSAYAEFTSNSITVDTVGTETMLGERVRAVGVSQFTSDPHTLTLSLDGVFSPSLSGSLSTFTVAIGDSVQATNILDYTPLTATNTSFMNLDLQDGRTYYITVQAISPHGIITTSVSHPLTVDLTPPTIGHMFTGRRSHDVLAQTDSMTYSARWVGFTDPSSGIHHYELALTQSMDTPPPDEYTDVGISLRGTLDSLGLSDGEAYYPHLVAVGNAGVRSPDFVLTRGLVIDTSPPVGLSSDVAGGNILSNPSFEGVSLLPCEPMVNHSEATQNWTVDGASDVLTVYSYHDNLPYDGCQALLFAGRLSQSMPTQTGLWYRVSLAAHAYTLTSHTPLTLSLPGVSKVCDLANRWTTCELLFQAQGSYSTLELTTLPHTGVVVDALSLVSLTEYSDVRNGSTVNDQPMDVVRTGMEQVIGQSRVRIHAHWLIADPESGVRGYQWAVGTVPGGQQKQSYRSSGTRSSVVSGPLSLGHSEEVFVTVVAENFAGLSRVFYSRPFVVDLTPPTSNGSVFDGDGSDRVYQREGVVWADWTNAIRDEEGGLVSCLWALGTSPGGSDLQPYTPVPRGVTSSHSNDLSPLPHGTTVYSAVKCLNGAGRYGVVYSDGVTILTTHPNASLAYSIVTSAEMTQYDIIPGYLPSNSLVLTWGGFADSAGTPLEYEVRVTNVSGGVGVWENVGFLRQLTLNSIELPSNDSSHVIQVRAVNPVGLLSEVVSKEFYFLTTPPVNSSVRVNDTWLSRTQLSLDWTDKFSSPAPLRYELSVGYQRGSGSIVKWVELSSDQTSITLTHPRLERSRDYYLTLTAIGESGLHTTHNQVIAGIPMVT